MPLSITLKEGQYLNENETPEIKGTPSVLKRWNAERGFGFLILEDGSELFCHVHQLCSHLAPVQRRANPNIERNQTIYVQRVGTGRKPGQKQAENVQCECCVSPDIWEIHPSEKPGDIAFGVRLMVAACVNHQNRDSYHFMHPVLNRMNVAYWEAKRKKDLFENPNGAVHTRFNAESYANFFETFGQPAEIRLEPRWNNLFLVYPDYGEVKIPFSHALEGDFFGITATGEWRNDTRSNQNNIEAVFNVAGVNVWHHVGRSTRYESELDAAFEKLSKEAQDAIIKELKSKIPNPKENAERDFLRGLEENDPKIRRLREEIIKLSSPGQAYFFSQWEVRHYSQPESPDGYRPGGNYSRNEERYYLNLGLREVINRKATISFSVSEKIARTMTPEEARSHLLKKFQARYHEVLRQAAKESPHFKDPRLATMSKEEWKARYQETFCVFADEQRAEYDEVDVEELVKIREAWQVESQVVEEAKAIYEEYKQLIEDNKALDASVQLDYDLNREYPRIKYARHFNDREAYIAHVAECIAKLKEIYAAKIEKEEVQEVLRKTKAEEREIAREAARAARERRRYEEEEEVYEAPQEGGSGSSFGTSLGDKLGGLKDLLKD